MYEEGEYFAKYNKIKFLETSAVTGENVQVSVIGIIVIPITLSIIVSVIVSIIVSVIFLEGLQTACVDYNNTIAIKMKLNCDFSRLLETNLNRLNYVI